MKYQKIPQQVEAHQYNGSRSSENLLKDWMHSGKYKDTPSSNPGSGIMTFSNGTTYVKVEPGDWIIKLPNGQFEHCPRKEFYSTYERATA